MLACRGPHRPPVLPRDEDRVNTPAPPDDPPTVRNFVGPGSIHASTFPRPATSTDLSTAFPEVGGEFLGFQLVRELGRGAYGRVYLATQGELAGRLVALKVSVEATGESVSLAQLQHTNIVPVYSVHHDHGLHAVCMPYFGGTTLSHLLRRCRANRLASGAELAIALQRWIAEADPDAPTRSEARGRAAVTTSQPPSGPLTARPRTVAVYDRLASLTFPQAVCWMVARMADGLAHAHDRGIVHRDIKPANVLITDDGQPMLLDFGVAADLKSRATRASSGGTVPYMAPEQLAELFTANHTADPRSDVYALGVILFEWLTAAHPFSQPGNDLRADLPRLLAERRQWVPRVRALAPDVPPDLEAIIHRCTAASPTRRYQTAADLSEDLRRHLAHEPLRMAVEPRGWWRVAKWRKRHPKLGAQLSVVGGALAGMALCFGAMVAWRGVAEADAAQRQRWAATAAEQERFGAAYRMTTLQAVLRDGRYRLAGRVNDRRASPADLQQVRETLAGYGLPDDPDWRFRPALTALPPDRQTELCVALSDACLLLARASLQVEDGGGAAAREAERYNLLAEKVRPGLTPRAVFTQRASIFTRLGRPLESKAMTEKAASTPLLTADDFFLSGDDLVTIGHDAEALPLLREAVRLDPSHFWAQFQLGVCLLHLGRPTEARASFSVVIALQPTFHGGYFNRAMASVALKDHREALTDLDKVLELDRANAPALLHRAHALATVGDWAKAMIDLDAVLAAKDPGGMHVRALLQRAKWKKSAGDAEGAAADTAAALLLTPTDEVGWLLRGLAQADANPEAALADIRQAVKLNPQYTTALRNQVFVLEKLGRYDEAVGVMNKVIALAPNDMLMLASRGLLFTRLGKVDEALRDTATALAKDRSTQVRVSAASTYALLSDRKPELKVEALKLIDGLVKDGYSRAELKACPELIALKDDPEFQRLTGHE